MDYILIARKGHIPSICFGSVGSEISGLSLSTPFDAPIGSTAASISNENGAESVVLGCYGD